MSRDEQAEFLKFFRSTKAHRDYCIVLTGLRAGLRISEVLGLRFDDIDLEGRAITVERQIVVSTGEVGEAKTASSARRVDIYSDVLLAALREQIHDRKEQNLQRGWRSDFLFVTKDGEPFTAASWQGAHLRPGFVGVGLGKVVPEGRGERYVGHVFHDLRHTFAIELYAATRDLKYVSKQLGHKSTVVTEGTYLRFFDAVDRERRETDLDGPRGARRAATAPNVVG